LVGEIGINAAFCGAFGCPVLLVTGDTASCREGADLLGPGLTTVAVKEAFGRNSARHVAPRRARDMIEQAARRCLGDRAAVPSYATASVSCSGSPPAPAGSTKPDRGPASSTVRGAPEEDRRPPPVASHQVHPRMSSPLASSPAPGAGPTTDPATWLEILPVLV